MSALRMAHITRDAEYKAFSEANNHFNLVKEMSASYSQMTKIREIQLV